MTGFSPCRILLESVLYRYAHTTSGSGNHANRAFERRAVEIGHLDLRNFFHLRFREFTDLHRVGFRTCRFDTKRFLDKNGCGGRLQNKRERTVLIDRYDHGNDETGFVCRFCVELLRESGKVDTERTKRRTYGRGRCRLPCGNLQLYECCDFLSHKYFLLLWF